ncbi:MAG: dienelactone hydrolase family protein [Aquabacterium sp.]
MTRPRLTAADFDPEVLRLFDQYVHGQLDRRGFIDRAARFAAGSSGAAAVLAALSPDFAHAQVVKPDDPRIRTETVMIDSPQGYGRVRALLAEPNRPGSRPGAVLVVHENRGLNPHIEDITRRLAVDGFLALAPDALHPLGGYPGDEDKARSLFPQLDQARTREDFVAAAGWLKASPRGNGRIGVIGFCYGGGMSNYLATRLPELAAAVPFYGAGAPLDRVPQIKARLLIHFADQDERINAGWPAYEAALKAAGVSYEAHRYPGTQHGFNNDTTPRFDAAAAALAWQRTLAHLRATLAG